MHIAPFLTVVHFCVINYCIARTVRLHMSTALPQQGGTLVITCDVTNYNGENLYWTKYVPVNRSAISPPSSIIAYGISLNKEAFSAEQLERYTLQQLNINTMITSFQLTITGWSFGSS